MEWLKEFKIGDVFSGAWEDLKSFFTPPRWVKDFNWSDFWGDVKTDFVKGTETVGEGLKGLLKGIRGILTPTVVWLIAIAVIALIIWIQFKKTLKT